MQLNTNNKPWNAVLLNFLSITFLLGFILLFFTFERFKGENALINVPDSLLSINTIFWGVVLEALPFILLGVVVSAFIQVYLKPEFIKRFLPKNPIAALLPATVMGAILPICECANVIVVRRLIKKGLPLHVGVVFLVAAPILNPVVFASTYYAFRGDISIVYSRMILAFLFAIIIGLVIYILFKNQNQLKWSKEDLISESSEEKTDITTLKPLNKFKQTIYHAINEFFEVGKFFMVGALIASSLQVFIERQTLVSIGSNEWTSILVMMGLAFILSLCSEADAFLGATFSGTFTNGSIIAFLVYGPMIDLKNTIMLLAYFKTRFVITLITVITILVFASSFMLQIFIF